MLKKLQKDRLRPVLFFGQLRWLLLVLALEILAFTTPLVEWVARPLLVPPRLRHADAIVVLGSGVLTGGHPTPWAEERVRYGVTLLHQGYAPRIIFSGGQTRMVFVPWEMLQWWLTGNHAQLEAETYAVFAEEALHVPSGLLFMEDRSHTTYENGLWTSRLLQHKAWKHILLVTSPTHMQRALGVFRALGIEADPAPVPHSLLYSAGPTHRFDSWTAVLHEYIGLAYYRLMGRI